MFNYVELKSQLEKAGIVDQAILVTIEQLTYVLDAQELSNYQRNVVLQLFSTLGLEQLEKLSEAVSDESEWTEFQIGTTTIGDIVRVKNVYDTETGKVHNGLVGWIESVFGGRARVRYFGRYADNPQEHPRENLEVLAKI